MTTLIIIITVTLIVGVAYAVHSTIKERNQKFEDKMKGIYNAELNEYFAKQNMEKANRLKDEINKNKSNLLNL